MLDLNHFNANQIANIQNNIFGLPSTEEDSAVILLPVPWEVTVSYTATTARAAESIFAASKQVDIFDPFNIDGWKQGFFMKDLDKKLLLKSDYLRNEAELYIDFIAKGEDTQTNDFIQQCLKNINEGSAFLNEWVYKNTKSLLDKNKMVGLLGGDHSVPFGYLKALAEKYASFGILQIDAHCDLRRAYENFTYSHASIMYNVLEEIPQVSKLIQIGIRDYCEEENDYLLQNKNRIKCFFDRNIKESFYRGEHWEQITETIINELPQLIYISFDVDGLDPKLCPHTGTPVPGGFEFEQVLYLLRKIKKSGRKFIGFDLVEVGVASSTEWDSNVGARLVWNLCNMMV